MQLIIEYPKLLPDALQQTRADFEQEAKMAMAVKLFEMKRLSSGIAARLAGMDRVTFLLSLHRYGIQSSSRLHSTHSRFFINIQERLLQTRSVHVD